MPWNAPQRKRFASDPSAFMSILVIYRAKHLEAMGQAKAEVPKTTVRCRPSQESLS